MPSVDPDEQANPKQSELSRDATLAEEPKVVAEEIEPRFSVLLKAAK
jgi:hypothetical protein